MANRTWNLGKKEIVLHNIYEQGGITPSLKAGFIVSPYNNLDDYLRNSLSFEKKIYAEHARLLKEKKKLLKLETIKPIWDGIDATDFISVFEGYPDNYRIISGIDRISIDKKERSDFGKTKYSGDAIGGDYSHDIPVTRLDFMLKDKSTDDKIIAWITSSDDSDKLSKALYSEIGDTISVRIVPSQENPHFAKIYWMENYSLNKRLSPTTI